MGASSSCNSTKLNHENAWAPIGDEIILALKGLKKEEF